MTGWGPRRNSTSSRMERSSSAATATAIPLAPLPAVCGRSAGANPGPATISPGDAPPAGRNTEISASAPPSLAAYALPGPPSCTCPRRRSQDLRIRHTATVHRMMQSTRAQSAAILTRNQMFPVSGAAAAELTAGSCVPQAVDTEPCTMSTWERVKFHARVAGSATNGPNWAAGLLWASPMQTPQTCCRL